MPQTRSPTCPNSADQCRITVTVSLVEPLIVWQPHYDGNGQQVNSDPNASVREYKCTTCGNAWSEVIPHTLVTINPMESHE
jgi:hypothetical protein